MGLIVAITTLVMSIRKNALDRIGISLSVLCAIHCVATPFVVLFSPWVGEIFNSEMGTWTASDVWRPGKQEGGSMQEEGIMNLGGVEKDYRETGGFVPIGKEEKADDVPARLSLNEFVMTADAVRGMGEGDIDKGAERMEDLMETLEVKGKRNQGASDMFEVSERLSAVV